MADESEAHKLRKQIAYLSGLINSAKNVPQATFSSYSAQRPKGSNSFYRPPAATYKSWNYQPNYHMHQYLSNSSNYSINRQKQLVPFPKSSKYVAKVFKSKQKTSLLGAKLSNTLTVDSKGSSASAKDDIKTFSENASKVSALTTDNGKIVDSKGSSASAKNDIKTFSENASKVSALTTDNGKILPKYGESSALLSMKKCLSESNSVTKKVSKITSVPKSKRDASHLVSSDSSPVKFHVNPKFLKKQESADLSTEYELASNENPSQSTVSYEEKTENSSSSNMILSCDRTRSKSVSRNSIINSSEIALTKAVINQAGLKSSNPSSNKPQISADLFSISCDVTGKVVHDLDTQAEIKKLRESLGYDVPDEATFKRMKSQYNHTVNYDSKTNNKTIYSIKKTKTFPMSSNSMFGSTSPYKLDKKRTFPCITMSKLDFTPIQKPTYVSHHTGTTNHERQYKLNLSSSPHSQKRRSSSKRLSGISKAQHAAKTIISKYKIRNIPAVIHKPYKTVNNSVIQGGLSSYNHLTKYSSRSTHNWRNTVLNNVYSWKQPSSDGSFPRQKPYNRVDQQHIQRKLHHLYKLDKKSNLRLNIARSSGSEKGCRLVFINGFLYKSTDKSMTKTGSKTVDNRKKATLSASKNKNSVIIKKISGKQMKTVKVRGVIFQMASDGHSLQRLDTAIKKETSMGTVKNKDVKVTRVDIGGVTYIQTKPGTLVRMATHRTRVVANRVINKSITTVTNKLRKKVNKQYCMYFNRFGKCKRDKKCPYLHDPEKIAVCTRFLRGTCKVKDCVFSHKVSQEKMPVCSYFLKGRCDKDDCLYLHVKVNQDAVICRAFLDGYCPQGKECKKLHSRVCSEFGKTGKCSKGRNCQLQHKKKRRSKTKEENTKKNMSEQETVAVEEKEEMNETNRRVAPLPAFIALSPCNSPLYSTEQNSQHKTTSQAGSLLIKPRL